METMSPPATSRLSGLSPTAVEGVLASARALELCRIDEAKRQIGMLLVANADHPEVLRLLAGLQNLCGRQGEAAATMRRALALRPEDALYLNTLGSILTETGAYDDAIAVLRHACSLDKHMCVAWLNLGIALVRSMRPAEAVEALQCVMSLAPDHVDAQCMLAEQLKAGGRIAEAIGEYRRVLARCTTAGMAWWGLADIKTVRFNATDVTAIQRALQSPAASETDLIAMGFALAKAFEDADRPEQALAALAAANARARQRQRWNAMAHSRSVDRVIAACSSLKAPGATDFGSEVIFIVSLPRSGSTLIEQILASHSRVEGAGELPDLPVVLTEEAQRRNQAFPQWVPAMLPQDWQRLGRRYLERTAHWRTRRSRFVDKLPYNWIYIGAIRAMLPGARIVIGRRDPLETCLSCYRQYLVNNEYTRCFDDLASFWRDFDRAVRHWRHLFPAQVHEFIHEELLADPEAKVRELLTFCELPFEPACMQFHKTQRNVHTPSAAQVRQPLRRDTARAARYGALLDPLRTALGLPLF